MVASSINVTYAADSPDKNDSTSRAKYECTEKVFNKTWGMSADNVVYPGCSDKSGKTNPYKVALTTFQDGVSLGLYNEEIPEGQAYLDAAIAFGYSTDLASKSVANIEVLKRTSQKAREDFLGSLNSCFVLAQMAAIFDSGKQCGEGTFWSYGLDKYSPIYKQICMVERKNDKVCTKLANESQFNYLTKHSSEVLAGNWDPYEALSTSLAVEINKPKDCERGTERSNMKDCYQIGIKKLTAGSKVESNKFFKKACDGGYMVGCHFLGLGEYVLGHKDKAHALFSKACEGDDYYACFDLGISEKEHGHKVASESAIKKACEGGYTKACDTHK